MNQASERFSLALARASQVVAEHVADGYRVISKTILPLSWFAVLRHNNGNTLTLHLRFSDFCLEYRKNGSVIKTEFAA